MARRDEDAHCWYATKLRGHRTQGRSTQLFEDPKTQNFSRAADHIASDTGGADRTAEKQ
jgi:hypothetical protein